jgi:predicted DNA-binding protein
MKQNTTESFRIEKDILENVKLITSKTGQTTKGYISIVLRKQIEKDLKKYFKSDILQNQREKSIINILSKC